MKYILHLAMLILLSQTLFSQTFNDFLKKGDDYYNKFDLKNAALNYEEAYKINLKDYNTLLKVTQIYNDLGEDYYEIKDEKDAEIAVNKAVKYAELFASKFQDSAKVYSLLAMSYGNLGSYKGGNEKIKLAYKIKENAEKSIKKDSNDYLPYIILSVYNRQIASLSWFERAFANVFFGKVPDGSLEESEKMMLKALSIQPGIVIAMFHLSLTYKEMDNEQKEIEWLRKVIDAPIINFRDKYAKRKAKERLAELID
ncbi:MAG: hypothetical protein Q8M94_01485 [Ignavibacteria bacterium]|nr:hypothetical protein [Ignavibacteria bacterium]